LPDDSKTILIISQGFIDVNFEAVQLIRSACDAANIPMVEATYRWLLCHSALNGELKDGILIGASSVEQLEQNLKSCSCANDRSEMELPSEVVGAFNAAWSVIQRGDERPFPYWRSYSSDMPNRMDLDPGASYSAAKAK
jgi:aflatoxin B1 aldehyde reductase